MSNLLDELFNYNTKIEDDNGKRTFVVEISGKKTSNKGDGKTKRRSFIEYVDKMLKPVGLGVRSVVERNMQKTHYDYKSGLLIMDGNNEYISNIILDALTGRYILAYYEDANSFNEINNNFGHDVGDIAISAIGSMLNEYFKRAADKKIRRYSGDEFVVLTTSKNSQDSLEETKSYLGKMPRRVAIIFDENLGYKNLKTEQELSRLEFSLSTGMCIFDNSNDNSNNSANKIDSNKLIEIIGKADKKMLKNKDNLKKDNKDFYELHIEYYGDNPDKNKSTESLETI